nr:hypothetical protein [uncultured Cohaesibacter sp.]
MTKTIIQLTSNNDIKCFLRQTPEGDGIWQDYEFKINEKTPDAEWLIAFDEPARDCVTDLPKTRRILFRTEPQSIKFYSAEFLNQFGTIVAIDKDTAFNGKTIISQVGLPWMYGLDFAKQNEAYQWTDLCRNHQPPIKGEISVVCSTKNMNINHSRRLRFLAMLKEALGDRLTIYGRGFQPIADKREAIDGYRYHLVLENNLLPHGWTEKLADPILGGVFPISAGAPDLGSFFNLDGLAMIDITKPQKAVAQVVSILEQDPASHASEAMNENKQRLLNEHNLFALIARIIDESADQAEYRNHCPLEHAYAFQPNKKPQWRKMLSIPKPIRPIARNLYLKLFERG